MKKRLVTFALAVAVSVSAVSLVLLVNLQSYVIYPMLPLPADICYYHMNDAPWWVELFLIDHSGHLSEMNLFLFFLLAIISTLSGIFISRKLSKRKG